MALYSNIFATNKNISDLYNFFKCFIVENTKKYIKMKKLKKYNATSIVLVSSTKRLDEL